MLRTLLIPFIGLLYFIGLVLYFFDSRSEFAQQSTEIFLVVIDVFILILVYSRFGNLRLYIFSLLVFVVTFICEVFGANFGWIFGDYDYGNIFRIKMMNVPLIIGVNWVILIFASGSLSGNFTKSSKLLHALLSGGILVLLDILIEPVAIYYGYWQWLGNNIPLQNYVAWFLLASGFIFIANFFKLDYQSKELNIFLIINFLFFVLLNGEIALAQD